MKRIFFILLLALVFTPAYCDHPSFGVTVTGKGQPIILIPGYTCGGAVWDETVDHLKNTYECHVIQLAGFAGQPPLEKGVPLLKTVKDELILYIRENKLKKPILVGHSLGAFMGLWVSSEMRGEIHKLICVDGVPAIAAMGDPNVNYDSLKNSPAYDINTVVKNFESIPDSGYIEQMIPSLLWQVNDTARARQIATWSYLCDRATMGSSIIEISLTDLRPVLSKITCPVLVMGSIYQTEENSYKILGQQYANVPHKEIRVANSKHFIMYDAPEWFYKEIDIFLAR